MTARLALTPAALQDLTPAASWYESQRTGLGTRFLSAFSATAEGIKHTPSAYPAAFSSVRRARLPRFPYMVYFVHLHGRVTVLGVLHVRRDPLTWRRRIH